MKTLLISLKQGKCTLFPSDLENYPDSLLSKIASSEAGSGAWDSVGEGVDGSELLSEVKNSKSDEASIFMDVSDCPDNPLNDWLDAPRMLPMLYRKKRLSTALLQQMLDTVTGCTEADSSDDTSSTHGLAVFMRQAAEGVDIEADALKSFYSKLAGFLEFLALPGPVSQWLPLQDIQLTDSRALEFSYACAAFEAADLMLSYRPHAAADNTFEHCSVAALLVTTCTDKAGLTVHKVSASNLGNLQEVIIQNAVRPGVCNPSVSYVAHGPGITVYTMINSMRLQCTSAQQLPTPDNHSRPFADIALELANKAVGPYPSPNQTLHPGYGRFLAKALHAACGTHLSAVACYVGVSYNTVAGPNVPLWVLQWF